MSKKNIIKKLKQGLSSKDKKTYEKERKRLIDKIHKKRLEDEKHIIKITKENEHSAINVVNYCIFPFAFENIDCDYAFSRTEPFFSEKKPNFDVLLKHKNQDRAILIECKHNLKAKASKEINEFNKNRDLFENNTEITDKAGNRANVKDFIASYGRKRIVKNSGDGWSFEYVLASEICDKEEIQPIAKDNNIDGFCLWRPQLSRNKLHIKYSIIEGNTPGFIGHKNGIASKLNRLWSKGCDKNYQQLIDFTLATNLDFMVYSVLLTFWGKKVIEFDYNQFKTTFRLSIQNYYEKEKQFIFKNFVDKCLYCKLIEIKDNKDNIYKNIYQIKTQYKRDMNQYIDEIFQKLAFKKMIKLTNKEKEEISLRILEKLIKQRGDTDITEYTT
ncbi:MAG: hypothetical protein PHU95_04390 [Candidatus Thermoplasmatota archaeon]|nr:hypothetical protein [Candidatus Thermoplasmatota archaeon]